MPRESKPPRPHTERAFFKLLYTPTIFELASRIIRFFGRPVYASVGRGVAWCYAVTHRDIREIVRRNLALLRTEPVTTREATAVFTSYGETIADYVAVGNMPPEVGDKLCAERAGLEHLQEALRHGKGAILATGHFGFFELGALLLGRMGYPVTIVTLSEHTPQLTAWRAAFRRRWGAETVEIGPDVFSSLRVVKVLEAGGFAAMLVDRPAGDRTMPVDLPNGRIAFSLSPALLAHLGDCPVVPVTITLRPDGTYRILAKACVWPRRLPGSRDEAVAAATRTVAASLVEEFCRVPAQWYHFVPIGLPPDR